MLCATAILRRRGLALGDIGLWELNEAFAAQVLACLAAWQDEKFCREILGLDGAAGATVSTVTDVADELTLALPATSVSRAVTSNVPLPWAVIVARGTVTVALLAEISPAVSE